MTEIITTAEELDALPVGSVVLDSNREAWQSYYDTDRDCPSAWVCRAYNDDWTSEELCGGRDPGPTLCPLTPLTVLYRPGQPAPSLPPTVERIADALEAAFEKWCATVDADGTDKDEYEWMAEAVHKLYPTCQPSRDDIEAAIQDGVKRGYQEQDVAEVTGYACFDDRPLDVLPWVRGTDAVLALLPGRSEAEVKAEALREAADAADREKVDSLLPGVIGLSWLRDRADRLAGGEQ